VDETTRGLKIITLISGGRSRSPGMFVRHKHQITRTLMVICRMLRALPAKIVVMSVFTQFCDNSESIYWNVDL
jgi:hypothetical protein